MKRSPTTAGRAVPAGDRQPVGLSSASLALFTAALWGGTPVAIGFCVDTLAPVAVAAMRFAMAAVFMVFWCRLEGCRLRLRPGQFRPALILGLLLFVQISLLNVGVKLSNSSHGVLLMNTCIFWVVVAEHFITKTDRLSVRKAIGLLIAGGSVLLIVSTTSAVGDALSVEARNLPSLTGDAVLFLSAVLLGAKIVYTKQALKSVEPGKLLFWHDLIGALLFAAYSLGAEEVAIDDFSTAAVWALVYQGFLVAGLCFAIQAQLLRRHSATAISVFNFTTPLFGLTVATLLRRDPLSPWLLVSGVCMALGILLVNLAPAGKAPATPSRAESFDPG